MTSEQPPQIYQYSVKLETTQKCVNTTVHVYSNDFEVANEEAIHLLNDTIEKLQAEGFKTAPLVEIEK